MQDTEHPVIETVLPVDLSLYEEVFISSTSMHVMPLTRINEQPIGDGQIGLVTKMAMKRFEAHYHHVISKSKI
jgi:branched-subunit amino acid aminotransferase/4-amino-4-deoxychorismate lyase